jgi:hypothetical protein
MPDSYVVKEGECLASVAYARGFFPDTIWSADANASLREKRRDGYTLAAGDEIVIPDKQPKRLAAIAGRKHIFRRKGVPEEFHLQLLDVTGKPRSGLVCTLTIDGVESSVTSDGDGKIRAFIAPDAHAAEVRVGKRERYKLQLGKLPPFDSTAGMQARLRNLGHDCGSDFRGELGIGTQAALAQFLRATGVEPPATWDDAAVASAAEQIRTAYGC